MKLKALLLSLILTVAAFGTVTDNYVPQFYTGDGSTTAFSFPWPVSATSEVEVILRTVATGAETVLTAGTDYAVSAVNNDYSTGGTVTTTATYTSASQVVIRRSTTKSQSATLTESDSTVLRLSSLESAYDKLTRIVQELKEENTRQITVPRTDYNITVELDDSVNRASTYLGCDSSGNLTTFTAVDSGTVTISAYMETVVAASDAATAKSLLLIPTISSFAETVLDDTTATAMRTTIGAVGLTGNEFIAGDKTLTGATTITGVTTLADTSALATSAAPLADSQIANKKYVDDKGLPYARMYQSGAQDNLTDQTWTTITVNTDDYDSSNITDTANYRITPAVAGQYYIYGQITYTNVIANKTYQAQLYKNASTATAISRAHTGSDTGDITVPVSDVVTFDADDYIQLRGYVSVGVATVDVNIGTMDTFLYLYRL